MEIFVGSNARKFTGSGTSMRKAKQAAASLALNEVGFKQFKTKQSRVEVGEDSSKAKVVEQIMARSQEEIVARSQGETMARAQGEIKVRSQRGGQTNKQRSRGQGWMEKGRAQESSIPRSKAGGLGFKSAMGYPSEGQVAMVDEVEGRSNQVFEQQPSTRGRKYDQAKSLRRPFTRHNTALEATSTHGEMSKGLSNGQRSAMNAPNQNLSTFEVGAGDTDDSGSFEDSDGSGDKGLGGSNLASFVRQQETELCNTFGIGNTQSSSRIFLEKKEYANRKLDTAERLCDDTSRIANVRPIMKTEK